MSSIFLRSGFFLLLATLGTWYCVAQAQLPAKVAGPTKLEVKDKQLTELVFQRAKLTRATNEPHQVFDRSKMACAAPIGPEQHRAKPDNPHEDFSVLVYLTNNGRDMMTSGKGIYPVGTAILKEKLKPTEALNRSARNLPNAPPQQNYSTELFTGMLKREAGYNPDGGDWEYFVVSGDANKLLARGKIDSCIDCHQSYKATDYVTRAYMPAGK